MSTANLVAVLAGFVLAVVSGYFLMQSKGQNLVAWVVFVLSIALVLLIVLGVLRV
jgi:hypothetical protein